jgi:cytochrome c peroxidase
MKHTLSALASAGLLSAGLLSPAAHAAGPDPRAMFQPIKAPAAPKGVEEAKVLLGQQLFHEARLSKNHDISCNSCHTLTKHGVDGEPTSLGHKGQRGGRNSPTVLNASGHLAQFWDGRAADVEAQAKGPVLNPVEMALPSAEAAVAVLRSMPEYVEAFKRAFPDAADPVTYDNFGAAVGAFERQLVTPSRFDKFLEGDNKALSAAEREGLDLFMSVGCTACHSGALLGGQMYQKVGLVKPWPNQADQGRFDLTKQESDRMVFKVPSLRNIERTAPYFHDGQTKTLDEAVSMMAEHQLGRTLEPAQVKSIVTFLKTLTAAPAARWLKTPTLPKSSATTPKADPN